MIYSIEKLAMGISIVTPLSDFDNNLSLKCSNCTKSFEIFNKDLGNILKCPNCQEKIKVNDFIIDSKKIKRNFLKIPKTIRKKSSVATDYEKIIFPSNSEELEIYKNQRLMRDPISYSFKTKFRQFNKMAKTLRNLGIIAIIAGMGILPQLPNYINTTFGVIPFLIAWFSYYLKINAIEEMDKNLFLTLAIAMFIAWSIIIVNNILINYLNIDISFIAYISSAIAIVAGLFYTLMGYNLLKL